MKVYSVNTISMLAICFAAGLLEAGKKQGNPKHDSGKKIVVTTTKDCGRGSLRWAIEKVNRHCCPEGAHIIFDLSSSDCGYNKETKTWCITPETDLPDITCNNVCVDGLSQPGSKPNTKPACKQSNACYKIELCGPGIEEPSAARKKTSKKATEKHLSRRGFGLLGNNIRISGLIARLWPVAIQSQSDYNELSQLLLKQNGKAITQDVSPSAPTTPITSLTVSNIDAVNNTTVVEATNALMVDINAVRAMDTTETALSFPAPTIPMLEAQQPAATITDSTVMSTNSTSPQVDTSIQTTATNLTVSTPAQDSSAFLVRQAAATGVPLATLINSSLSAPAGSALTVAPMAPTCPPGLVSFVGTDATGNIVSLQCGT